MPKAHIVITADFDRLEGGTTMYLRDSSSFGGDSGLLGGECVVRSGCRAGRSSGMDAAP